MTHRSTVAHSVSARVLSTLAIALLLGAAGCETPPPAPSPQGVRDTSADFMPPGSSLQGARRMVVQVDPARLNRTGGFTGTFTLTNRGSQAVILASVVTASDHVSASAPGAMPYRVEPGRSFSVVITLRTPWDRALTDGGLARVLTTEGETINLWLQLVSMEPVAPVGTP